LPSSNIAQDFAGPARANFLRNYLQWFRRARETNEHGITGWVDINGFSFPATTAEDC
jgi:hypothetical protein